jgi:hypothetical protein
LMKEGLKLAAMEVFHTHLTDLVKVQAVRESGIEIAEFRSDEVMRMPSDGRPRTKLENIKF